MVKRVVIYGWVVPVDRIRGPGSGALVDLVYFVDDQVDVGDVIRIVVGAGFKLIPKRYGNRRDAPVEKDKVTIEDWEPHISGQVTVGSEKLPDDTPPPPPGSRYEYPARGI
jgi:hypothetical protein